MTKPVVLCILDRWGISDRPDQSAPDQAATPNFDRLMRDCPHATLTTFGPDVGLPRGQMGNSEVGHTNIGAGRVVAMDLGQIDLAIEDGSFVGNDALVRFVERLRATGGTAHLMGVVMNGVARSQRGGGYSYGYGYESTYHKSHDKYLQGTGKGGKKSRRAARAKKG